MTHNEKCNLQTLGTPNLDLKDPHGQEIIYRRQMKVNRENLFLNIFDTARLIYRLLDIRNQYRPIMMYQYKCTCYVRYWLI